MTMELSEEQRQAVRYVDGPTLVTAGAGSGKTRTLTAKIAYLVNGLGYRPDRILAITFTNKAAAEMKARLVKITGRPAADFPWVRTFHSACFLILKEHCEELGYRKPLIIHSEYHQKTTAKKVLAHLDIDRKYLGAVRALISRAKNSGSPLGYIDDHRQLPRCREAYELYNEILAQQNAVDFDDILLLTRDLLHRNPSIRKRYQNAFDYILIDEYQDSNGIQNAIVDLLLLNGNLTVVGDDYQSIYQFRGADPSHFITFPEKYPEAKVFRLERNYRSSEPIVAAADALIAHNRLRLEKTCFSTRPGPPIQLRSFLDENGEASWIARKCWEYRNYKKIRLEDMAVLYRTKFCSLGFERALRAQGLPYRMVGGRGFFERREIIDINAYLISAVNVRDDASFERVINVPKRGIGAGTVKKILTHRKPGASLQQSCRLVVETGRVGGKAAKALQRLLAVLDGIRRLPPADAIRQVLEETGYMVYMEGYCHSKDDFDCRRENLEQLIYSASEKRDIAEYLEECALLREDQDDQDDGQGVRLSTFHGAKGLEYRVVFVAGLEEGMLPHWKSVSGDGSEAGIEEERRLLYVAMTRAMETLHLSWTKTRRGQLNRPSRFLKEIPETCLQNG